ncbi:MAG TPA: transglutaminase domain-containing protein [Bacillota bacterium]|nr:transglutaminase domain-containing protein [Bacillota bacterium]
MKKFLLTLICALVWLNLQASPGFALNTYNAGTAEVSTEAEIVTVLKSILLKQQPGIYQVELAPLNDQDYDVDSLKEKAFQALSAGNLTFFAEGYYYQGDKLVLRVDKATLRANSPAQYTTIINRARTGKLKNFSVLIPDYRRGLYNLSPNLGWTWHRTDQNVGAHGMLVTYKAPAVPVNKTVGTYTAANSAQLKNVLDAAMKNLNGTIRVRVPAGIDTQTITSIMDDLEDESLYIEYVRSWSCRIYKRTMTMTFTYPYDYPTMKQLQAKTEAKAAQVAARLIKPGMTDYQKVLAINDYLTATTTYDKNDLYLGIEDEYNQLAAGPLLRGKAVCGGYSRAAIYLLRKARIPCWFVSGTADNGQTVEDHAWNIVWLKNGKYYNLDVTWNDSDETPNYGYFLVDDKTLSRSHTWDASLYPKCTDASLNYYRVNNLIAEDQESFATLISQTMDRKKTSLTFLSRNFRETWIDLVFELLHDAGLQRRISYGTDPATDVVSILFLE